MFPFLVKPRVSFRSFHFDFTPSSSFHHSFLNLEADSQSQWNSRLWSSLIKRVHQTAAAAPTACARIERMCFQRWTALVTWRIRHTSAFSLHYRRTSASDRKYKQHRSANICLIIKNKIKKNRETETHDLKPPFTWLSVWKGEEVKFVLQEKQTYKLTNRCSVQEGHEKINRKVWRKD